MAQIVQLRTREHVDFGRLPNPHPYCVADVRRRIDAIGLPLPELASWVNRICRYEPAEVTSYDIELWLSGEGGGPTAAEALALLWMSGLPPVGSQDDLALMERVAR